MRGGARTGAVGSTAESIIPTARVTFKNTASVMSLSIHISLVHALLLVVCLALPVTACFLEQPAQSMDTTDASHAETEEWPTQVPDHDVETGRVVRLTRTDDTELNPAWSPVADTIAFQCYDDGWVRNLPNASAYFPGGVREVRNWPIHSYYIPGNICVMNEDGSGRVQLTDEQGDDSDPAWSPDGSKVAFSSRREGGIDIYIVNADGSGLKRVTDGQFADFGPTWSPDGSRIAYTSQRNSGHEIVVMNADGSNPTQITDRPEREWGPTWSPNGNQIAYTATGDVRSGIYVMNTDGTGRTLLYATNRDARSPAWSPDGKTIAFASEIRHGWNNNHELFMINIDGSGLTRLTYRSLDESSPSWSPDGKMLTFGSRESGNFEIYVMVDLETHNQRLTDNTYADIAPAWSPDGTRIAFVSDRDGDDEVYIMNADGTGVAQLTDNDRADYGPVWSPDGSRIAYLSSPPGSAIGHYDIFLVNVDGSDLVLLASKISIATSRLNSAPSWSPDGSAIAFLSNLDSRHQAYVINSDGTQQVALNVKNCQRDGLPYIVDQRGYIVNIHGSWSPDDARIAWSPDGTRIALTCLESLIRLIHLEDGTQSSIWACHDPVSSPAWSPDSTHIAFTCRWSDNDMIYLIDLNHADVTRFAIVGDGPHPVWAPYVVHLPEEEGNAVQPAWSPDGTKIAFASDRDGDYEIYVLDLERAP